MPAIAEFQYDLLNPQAKLMQEIDRVADAERQERAGQIKTYWDYYNGDHPDMLKTLPGKINDNVKLNHCGNAVDRKASFLAPEPPAIEIPEGPETLQANLDAWFDDNDYEDFIAEMAVSAIVTGHTFVKLYWETPDENVFQDTETVINENGQVLRFGLLDPCHVTCFWKSGKTKRALWWRVQYTVEGNEYGQAQRRQDIIPAQLTAADALPDEYGAMPSASGWLIIDYELKQGGQWYEVSRDEWLYPFSPVIDWPNKKIPNKYYGASDLTVYALNNSINFVASNTARIVKFHAHPRDIIKGAEPPTETAIDGAWLAPLQTEVIRLPNTADLPGSMQVWDKLETRFYAAMRVVDMTSIKDKIGQLTNFGVRMLFSDMLADIESKHRLYGAGLGTLAQRAIYLLWGAALERPEVKWEDALPMNQVEAVQVAQAEKDLGFVSDQTIAEQLDLDYDAEQEKLNAEGDSAVGLMERLSRIPDMFQPRQQPPQLMGQNMPNMPLDAARGLTPNNGGRT